MGPDAAEIMQGIGIALKAGATKKHFDSTVGIHPSLAEVRPLYWVANLHAYMQEFVSMREKTRTVAGVGTAMP